MATNKLMEAAADILSGSKSRAPGMPTQKLDGATWTAGVDPCTAPQHAATWSIC